MNCNYPKIYFYYIQKSCTFAPFFENRKILGKFDTYRVDLRNIAPAEVRTYEYLLDNKFFIDIDGQEVQKGKVHVTLNIAHKTSWFELLFHLIGNVYISCDRCLDEMEMPIETDNRLIVKLGKEYAEESDEVLIISEDDDSLNLAWFLYEFVALAIPMKHLHPPGKCNRTMTSKLKKYSAKQSGNEEMDDFIGDDDMMPVDNEPEMPEHDPRWDSLKELR